MLALIKKGGGLYAYSQGATRIAKLRAFFSLCIVTLRYSST